MADSSNSSSNRSVLITGVAGLLGSRFAAWLRREHPERTIIGIDDLSGGYRENVPEGVDFHEISLLDHEALAKIFESNDIQYVYHFAAYAAEGLSPFIRRFNYGSNLICTANLITQAIKHRVQRFVFTSSMAVYGNNELPFHEDLTPMPIDPYGIAKFACEMDIKVAADQHGLDYCIIRPHNVYGPGQNIWDKYRNVAGIFMRKLINGEPLTIYGDGEQQRAFTFIEDILESLWRAATTDATRNQTFNLGGFQEVTINQLADMVIDVAGKGEKVHLEPRHEVKLAYCDHERVQRIMGFEPKTSLRDGMKAMWDWAQGQPNREVKKWESYELEVGLYDYWK